MATATKVASQEASEDVKRFSLREDWAVGDGRMKAGASLTFRPDGTGCFEAVVYTKFTHRTDQWHLAFLLFSQRLPDPVPFDPIWMVHHGLFAAVPRFHGPEMDSGAGGVVPTYRWKYDFDYDRGHFPKIADVYWMGEC